MRFHAVKAQPQNLHTMDTANPKPYIFHVAPKNQNLTDFFTNCGVALFFAYSSFFH